MMHKLTLADIFGGVVMWIWTFVCVEEEEEEEEEKSCEILLPVQKAQEEKKDVTFGPKFY